MFCDFYLVFEFIVIVYVEVFFVVDMVILCFMFMILVSIVFVIVCFVLFVVSVSCFKGWDYEVFFYCRCPYSV